MSIDLNAHFLLGVFKFKGYVTFKDINYAFKDRFSYRHIRKMFQNEIKLTNLIPRTIEEFPFIFKRNRIHPRCLIYLPENTKPEPFELDQYDLKKLIRHHSKRPRLCLFYRKKLADLVLQNKANDTDCLYKIADCIYRREFLDLFFEPEDFSSSEFEILRFLKAKQYAEKGRVLKCDKCVSVLAMIEFVIGNKLRAVALFIKASQTQPISSIRFAKLLGEHKLPLDAIRLLQNTIQRFHLSYKDKANAYFYLATNFQMINMKSRASGSYLLAYTYYTKDKMIEQSRIAYKLFSDIYKEVQLADKEEEILKFLK